LGWEAKIGDDIDSILNEEAREKEMCNARMRIMDTTKSYSGM
jgi:hypothetical protein